MYELCLVEAGFKTAVHIESPVVLFPGRSPPQRDLIHLRRGGKIEQLDSRWHGRDGHNSVIFSAHAFSVIVNPCRGDHISVGRIGIARYKDSDGTGVGLAR